MTIIRSLLAVAVMVCALGVPAPAAAQVLFRMDYSAAAAPDAGWNATETSGTHVRNRVAGAGPNGEDVYDLTQRPAPSLPMFGGEFYWGWSGHLEDRDPAQGSRRFYRWRMRFSPNTNFRGIDTTGSPTSLINKILLVGDGCGRSNCRVILNYRGASDRQAYFQIQIDGGSNAVSTPAYNVGEWITVQVEIDSSTSTSSGDGAFKIWINNNNYNSPTAVRTGFQLNPINWRYVMLGAYNNNGLASNGAHSFQQTGFEVSTAFDATFHRSGGTNTLPTAPANLRVVPQPQP